MCRVEILDLSSLYEVAELARQVIAGAARLDVLVNNAGGLKATLRLVIDPTLENLTGEYFDGLSLAKANPQAYDKQVWQRLAVLTRELVSV